MNAPQTSEGIAVWKAAPVCVVVSETGAPRLDVSSALALATALGADPPIAAELLLAVSIGFNRALVERARHG